MEKHDLRAICNAIEYQIWENMKENPNDARIVLKENQELLNTLLLCNILLSLQTEHINNEPFEAYLKKQEKIHSLGNFGLFFLL